MFCYVDEAGIRMINYNNLNNRFIEIERQIKERICNMNVKNPSDSVMQTIVNAVHSLTKESINNIYLTSIALLIDDFFQITFPETEDFSVWDIYAFRKEGIIGDHCEKARETHRRVFIFPTKNDLIKYINLPQRDLFATGKVGALFISPIILHTQIIGNIMLSLDCDIKNEEELQEIKDYLIWLNDKIVWVIYSEFVRLNGIIEKSEFLLNALDSVDEYQSYHSLCVSKIAKIFGFIISKHKTYKEALSKFNNFKGIDIFQLQLAGLCHDIGKINMWSFEKFDCEIQYRKRQLHSFFSYAILNKCEMPERIAEITGNHHESINGSGYPFALMLGNESNLIEAQIIKFVDKVDSSIRERGGQDERNKFDVALEAVEKSRPQFNENIYIILYSILQDIRNGNLDRKFYELFGDAQHLLGLKQKTKQQIKVKINNHLQDFINNSFNRLDFNKWIVLCVFSCDNIDSYLTNGTISFKNNDIAKIKEQRNKEYIFQPIYLDYNLYFGVYIEEDNKEYAYSFCESFDVFLGSDNKMASAFLSHRIIHLDDFQIILNNCMQTLQNTCSNMQTQQRWRLLKFDTNKKEWK